MDVEWWKLFFEIGGVVLLFLTFAFGAGFMLTGKVVNERQSAQLRQFDKHVAGLQKTAADAKATQQGVEIELAQQREKAAAAERSLLVLQQKLNWREISPDQRRRFLAEALGKRKGAVTIVSLSGDAEAKAFAEEIKSLLKDAGWDSPPITTGLFLSPNDVGLSMAIVSEAAPTKVSDTEVSIPQDSPVAYGVDLEKALMESGFVLGHHGTQTTSGKAEVTLVVGAKP